MVQIRGPNVTIHCWPAHKHQDGRQLLFGRLLLRNISICKQNAVLIIILLHAASYQHHHHHHRHHVLPPPLLLLTQQLFVRFALLFSHPPLFSFHSCLTPKTQSSFPPHPLRHHPPFLTTVDQSSLLQLVPILLFFSVSFLYPSHAVSKDSG